MSKINQKKQEKEEKLLDAGFDLFISKGINETTIQDIVDEAGVAKGTFYLYFKDRHDLIDAIISKKTAKLFNDAIEESRQIQYKDFTEQFLFIIDYIIDALNSNKMLLKFIYKNLSEGIRTLDFKTEDKDSFKSSLSKDIFEMFMKRASEDGLPLENPKVTFFMIIELVGSTCYNAILFERPLPIKDYKPYLYTAIHKLLK